MEDNYNQDEYIYSSIDEAMNASDCPCNDCDKKCQGYEAEMCCKICHFLGIENCDNCDLGEEQEWTINK